MDEVAAVLRMGRTAAYEAIRRGEIPSLRLGRSIRVPREGLRILLAVSLSDAGPATMGVDTSPSREGAAPAGDPATTDRVKRSTTSTTE